MDRRRDPLLVSGYAVVAAGVVLLHPPSILAVVLVAPLVLLAPGLSLVMALDIDGVSALPGRRLTVSVALSFAVAAVGGILIDIVAPLTEGSWLAWLVGVTCVASAVALRRRRRAPATVVARSGPWSADWLPVERRGRWLGVAGVSVLILAGAITLTEVTSRRAYDTPLTELSVQPATGSGGADVELSVANRSGRIEDLRLTVLDGKTATTVSTVEDLKLAGSGGWRAKEPVGPAGLSAVLRSAGRSRPIAEVRWNGVATARSTQTQTQTQPR